MMTNDSTQQLQRWAGSIQPNQQYKPVDLLPGGSCAPPREAGLEFHIDPSRETVKVFRAECGAFVKTLSPWGANEFRIAGLDLLEALREVCRVGYPSWKCSMDERKTYLLKLLEDAEPVAIPERAPMNRSEMEQYIDRDAHCQIVVPAFTESVNASGRLVSDADLRELIQRASADPNAAIVYYGNLAAGRMGATTAPASEKSGRRKVGAPAAVEVAS